MTEYEKLRESVVSATRTPEYQKFSEWSVDKQLDDPVRGRLDYADYLRKVHIDAGIATPEIEVDIRKGLFSSLIKDGSLKEGDYSEFQKLTAVPDVSFETKLNLAQSYTDSNSEGWKILTDYKEARNVFAEGDEQLLRLQEGATEVLDRQYEIAKRNMLQSGELPFIATTDEQGNRVILAGEAANRMSFSKALEVSKAGGVSLSDAYLAKGQLDVVAGTKLQRFKYNRFTEALSVISSLSEKDSNVSDQIKAHAQNLGGKEDEGFLDWSARKLDDVVDSVLGFFSEETEAQNERMENFQNLSTNKVIYELKDKLNSPDIVSAGEEFSYEDVKNAYDYLVLQTASSGNYFDLYEENESGRNIRMTSAGIPIVHTAALANENAFNDMVSARPDIDPEIFDQLRVQRTALLNQNFNHYDKILSRSGVDDEWREAVMEGRANGKQNHEILNDFLKNEDNYNTYWERTKGVLSSVVEGSATLLAAIPAVMRNESAANVLAQVSQDSSDRREFARLFNQEYGYGMEVAEAIAPMATDVLATTLLAGATAPIGGLGGATYLTARAGSVAGLKALTKGITSNVIKLAPSIIGRGGATKTLAEVIATSLKTVDGKLANDALKAYNKSLGRKLGVTTAVFVPAATRSGGSTYGSITNALRQTTDLSKEEIHDRAMGAAMLSGTITGVITSGFSFFGRGGLEDAFLRGMSFREFKTVLSSLDDFASTYTTGKVKDVLTSVIKKAPQSKGGFIRGAFRTTHGFTDEAIEEGLDQFINSYVEDVALEQDTPMIERLEQSFNAAVVGGIIGSVVTTAQRVAPRFQMNAAMRQQQESDFRRSLFEKASESLRESGSPITASVLEAQYSIAARVRPEDTPLIGAETQPEVVNVSQRLEGKTPEELEQVADTVNQDLGQNYPEILQKKSLPEILSIAESVDPEKTPSPEQEAAIAIRDNVVASLDRLDQAAEQEAADVEEETSNKNAQDTEEIISDIQGTPDQILRRKVNQVLSSNSPEKLDNFPKSKKGKEKQNAKKISGPIDISPEDEIEVVETEVEVSPLKTQFIEEPDIAIFKSGKEFTEEEADAVEVVLELAEVGFPVRFNSNKTYGVPFTSKKLADASEFLAKQIFSKYPLIQSEYYASKFTGMRAITRFDPAIGKIAKGKVKGLLDNRGNGIFNNDPVTLAEMLAHEIRIPVPDSVNVFDINPSIKVRDGFVVDVIKPSDTGIGVESAVTPVTPIKSLEFDLAAIQNLTRIPFIEANKDDNVMPFGAREINERGFTQDVSDRKVTYGDIKRQLNDFYDASKTDGSLRRTLLQGSRGATLQQGYDLLDDTNADIAFNEAYLEYNRLLHLFELKGVMESQMNYAIEVVAGESRVKNNKKSKNAVKKALLSRVDIGSEAELAQAVQPFIAGKGKTHTDSIVGYVDTQILNNDAFKAGSMPTFDSVFKKKVKNYIAKEKVRGVQQLKNVEVDNVNFDFDQIPDTASDIYGEGDQGVAYSGSLGSVDASDTLDDATFYNTLKDAISNMTSQIEASPALKASIVDLYIEAIQPNATPRMRGIVSEMETSDLMGHLGTYLGTGSHTSRPEVLEFVRRLEKETLDAGVNIKDALYLSYLTYRYEGNPLDNSEAIAEVQRLMSESLGRTFSRRDAANFIKSMDQAVRRRFSRAHVSEEVRAILEQQNAVDVERLGLVDGDPESVISALKKIAKTSDSKSHKLVAELLLEDEAFLRTVEFSLGESLYPVAGQHSLLKDGRHVVYVNLRTGNGLGLENVLLEEYTHAFLSDVANKPEDSLNDNQRAARQRLQNLFTLAEKEYRKSKITTPVLEDAFENFDEFLANFLLSPKLQAHIKSLEPPKGQRGFFQRIMESLISMFRKLTGREKNAYTEALTDVISLSKTPFRTTAVPPAQAAMESAESASRDIKEVTEVLGTPEEQSREVATPEQIESQPDLDQEKIDNSINNFINEVRSSSNLASADQQRMESIMLHLKNRLPLGVEVSVDLDMDAPASATANTVQINPKVLMRDLQNFDLLGSKVYVETLIHHELAHVASFNALTKKEISDYVMSLVEGDFIGVANTYYRDPAQRDAAIDLIQTKITEDTDPEILNAIAIEKQRLAEEKLRMHLEKVRTGTTTEDDYDFWSSDPSIFRIITRYIRAYFSRLSAAKQMNRESTALDSLLVKVNREATLLNLGFNRNVDIQSLDVNDPDASALEFARLVNYDPVEESSILQEQAEGVVRLYASTTPTDFPNVIMAKARLRMSDASEFVSEDRDRVQIAVDEGYVDEQDARELRDLSEDEVEAALQAELQGEFSPTSRYKPVDIGVVNPDLNLGAIVSAVESLSNDTYKASVDIFEDDISGYFRLDVKLTNPSGELIGRIEDTEILPSGVVSIGYMANQTDAAKGFSSDLMSALIMVSEQAGINKVVTEAAGSSKGFAYKRKLVNTYNDITNSLSEEESEATKKQFLADAKLKQAFAMNGYYTWPSMGFKPNDPKKVQGIITRASNPEYAEDFAEDLVDEVLFNKSKFLRDLPEDKKQVIVEKLREDASNISASIVRSAKFLESIAVKDANGDIDLNKTLNEGSATQNKMAAKAWKSIGESIDVTFDLTEGSDSLKAYARKTIPPLLFRRIKEVRPLVSEFKQAKDQPDVDIESLRDEYNDRAAALGINFKLFASRGMPTATIANLDFSNVVKLLEMPMVEFQTYKKPERWIDRILIGDVGSPVRDLIEQRDEFKRASYSALKAFQAKFKKVLEKDQIVLDDAMLQTIADAQGYFDGNLVSEKFYAQEEAAHKDRRDAIKADDQLTKAQKKTNIATSRQLRDKNIADAEDAAISAIEASQNKAVQTLSRRSPDLTTLITSMRKELIQPIQNKLTEAGVSKDIKIRIDKTGGFYLTRAYRIFDDPTYANKVREDKNYAKIRQAAMDYFEKRLKDTARAASLQKNSDTAKAEAAAVKALRDANKEAGNGKSYAQNVLEEFISRYEGVVSGDSTVSNRYSKVVKNLTKRKDLDKSLRDLLGEYGKESVTDLIVRTFSVVSNLAAEQVFRSNLAEVGKKQGFLVDANTARKNPELYTELKPSANRNDPLYNLFVKKEMFDDLKDVVTPPYGSSLNSTSEKTLSSVAAFLQNITGKSMLFKTLGSVGFYFRNILGNALFFGPAQGMNTSWNIFTNSFGFSKEMWKDPNKLDAYLTELVGLGVFGDELRAGTIRELLSGGISPEAKMSKLNELIEKIPTKARETGKAITKGVEEKLTNLSASIDGSYKIAYYEHELSILRQAKKDHPNTKIGRLEDYDLKRMAAKKVKMTAQSLSQAPPIVRDMTKGSYGLLLAPFLRFKAEVPRIVWNTYKLAKEEKASDNPTIAARGRKRFNAMTMMLGVFSTSSSSLLSWLMGIGDDEEEALRKSMPEYLRGHSFFYFGDLKNLMSIDLTYLNPFSLLADPVMRAFESISKGDVLEGVGNFIQGLFLDQYLDEQILAGSLMDIKENRDSTTGRRIWVPEADSFGTALYKGMSYLFEGAYQPRVVKDVIEAVNAAGGDYHKFSDSPLGELLDGAYPVKTHSVDAEQQFRRFLRDHTSRLSDVTQQKFRLYGDKPISDDDVRDIYEADLKGRMALNKELYRATRGFDKLGVGVNRQLDLMKQYGIGKDKARLIFFGVMDRPDVNKRFLDGLTQRGKLKQAAVLYEERNKQPRYLMLKD